MASRGADEDEVRLARALVNPDKQIRDKTVVALQTYIESLHKNFSELDMLKLWKALFYCFWCYISLHPQNIILYSISCLPSFFFRRYSDKALIQQEVAEELSKLIHKFTTPALAQLFFQTFFRTMLREWHFIDQYRINKFYVLIRLVLREGLESVKRSKNWNESRLVKLMEHLDTEVLTQKPNGIRFHIAEIFLSEVYEVSGGAIPSSAFDVCLQPFLSALSSSQDNVFVDRVIEKVFKKLIESYVSKEMVFNEVEMVRVKEAMFEVAAEESCRHSNRHKVYDLHKDFQRKLKSSCAVSSSTSSSTSLSSSSSSSSSSYTSSTPKLKRRSTPEDLQDEQTGVEVTPKKKSKMGVVQKKKESLTPNGDGDGDGTRDAIRIKRDFIPSPKFIGSKKGYKFTNGDSGVGYYVDTYQAQATPSRTRGQSVVFGKNQSKGERI